MVTALVSFSYFKQHGTTWCRVFNIFSLKKKDSANGNDKSGGWYHATRVPRTQFSDSGKCTANRERICRRVPAQLRTYGGQPEAHRCAADWQDCPRRALCPCRNYRHKLRR